MEYAQDMYLSAIERAVYEFGQAVSGGLGLDLLQDKYDHYIESSERYLDVVNEAYQVSTWYSKLQQDIDNTTNSKYKERLKALQEEIDIRRENNTLSEYDLEILEAKYKVLQAQMELEDAQNNKSQLKLVRDSNGNWNYQYTADADSILEAQ
jgi:transposase-like protein